MCHIKWFRWLFTAYSIMCDNAVFEVCKYVVRDLGLVEE